MPTPKPTSRWFRLSPDRFVISLVLVTCLLWLSDRFQWFGFNHHKGWAVLIAVAAVGVAALVMLLWWIVSLMFRWRFQFGIRSVLAFCLACSIAVGWLAVKRERAGEQRRAVEEIEKLGAGVGCDFEFDKSDNLIQGAEPPVPVWLRNLLGNDFFTDVTEVTFLRNGDYVGLLMFDDDKITDAGLVRLKGFAKLKSLILHSSKVTDAGLANLVDLSQLRSLDLRGPKLTDAGLVHIAGLTRLESLDLGSINITDAGLATLKGLTALDTLNLSGTQITNAGLEHLTGLAQLRNLRFYDTRITDAGVKTLQIALPNCTIDH